MSTHDYFYLGFITGAFIFGACQLMLGSPWSARTLHREWRQKEKELNAAVVRASFMRDEYSIKVATADQMAHACTEPERSFLSKLINSRS